MKQTFRGWNAVSQVLKAYAQHQQEVADSQAKPRLNAGQRASLVGIADRIGQNGVIIADEVGMGKTRIAVELTRAVIECGGRVAILIPPGLGYQWQDELQAGSIVAPDLLRGIGGYFAPWRESDKQTEPWAQKNVVLISHLFSNWRLGAQSESWRWSLLPQLLAHWRKRTCKRLPQEYNTYSKMVLRHSFVCSAAENIVNAIPDTVDHPAAALLSSMWSELGGRWKWKDSVSAAEYSNSGEWRTWLEQAVGLGLGVFDLIIIDEAHKSRGTDSGLSTLLDTIILPSKAARRLAMTATPVELDVKQWWHTLSRIGVDKDKLQFDETTNDNPITAYAEAVKRVRGSWRTSEQARAAFKCASSRFQDYLSPYLLRRDKREDAAVLQFHAHSGLPINAYRDTEQEIVVQPKGIWRHAVCAAESLSMVIHQRDDSLAKRLRLTIGNGHGIASFLAREATHRETEERETAHSPERAGSPAQPLKDGDQKRQERGEWWLSVLGKVCQESALFEHPAILAAVEAIEHANAQREKVLVFGRFTSPMRALVDLLNAREMLRRLHQGKLWPHEKVREERDNNQGHSEWPAVRAAHHQLASELKLGRFNERALSDMLKTQYGVLEQQRSRFRDRLLPMLNAGFDELLEEYRSENVEYCRTLARYAKATKHFSEREDLIILSRALFSMLVFGEGAEDWMPEPKAIANGFIALIKSASDRDDPDDEQEGEEPAPDGDGSHRRRPKNVMFWDTVKAQLKQEYSSTEGSFARLMHGRTPQATRRMLQLAFNRANSFPKVLVAQSTVGREGLNLHEACRIVVLLHPEWNPAVVEQQIGRVDRVASHWSKQLDKALHARESAETATEGHLPRIEVRPVIFMDTYDGHNWRVLRERWDDLRAQLHGVVLPPRQEADDAESRALLEEINRSAPNFSPVR
jgi:hypothetical protein